MSQAPTEHLQEFLKTLTSSPGVYRMLNASGEVIYVGKARNLKKRVSSYFRSPQGDQDRKRRALVANVEQIEITVTHTENEALILENSLIKEHRPRYNILLRDDKSYPYVFLSSEPYPRLTLQRGSRRAKGRYFGPYPSSGAVRDALNLLQKLFPIRQCDDNYFRNRSRPCLQYQIKRCSAPCVALVTPEEYQEDVRHTEMFLDGKDNQVIDELVKKMEQAAGTLEFEQAARYRDQIAHLRRTQERQYVEGERGDIDIVAVEHNGECAVIQLFTIRNGRNLGNKLFFPHHIHYAESGEIIAAFITQHYLNDIGRATQAIPPNIILSHPIVDSDLLCEALAGFSGHKVTISSHVRGERARWLKMAVTNAEQSLASHLTSRGNLLSRYEALQEALGLETRPNRIECYDISHTMGEVPVASCVVFDTSGALKSDYRHFNVDSATPGDDYGAMRQVLERRFRRLIDGEGSLPDVILIDGGKGQLRQATEVLSELHVVDITLVGVAKGPSRKPGREQLFLPGSSEALKLPENSPALHLIQQIRDEAHRFAITGHRQRRAKKRRQSPLEEIPGLGPKRRQQLLQQFGGLQELVRAGVEDLSRVKGISREMAQRIYDTFHSD